MRYISAEAAKAAITGWQTDPTDDELEWAIDQVPTEKVIPEKNGVWKYHNDNHGQWWDCTNCGKILHRPPNDKLFCSSCGSRNITER